MSNKENTNKFIIDKRMLIFSIVIVVAGLLVFKFTQATDPKPSLKAWEDVHQWRADGECADCHSEHEYVTDKVDFSLTSAIPAPESHTDKFKYFNHGKGEKVGDHSCSSCHKPDACKSCHAIKPETHTRDFLEPTGESVGSLRHIALGKTNPAGCLACHQSFVTECTGCHAVSEVKPWQLKSSDRLSRWHKMLNIE